MAYPTRFQLLLITLILAGSVSAVSGQGRGANGDRARAIEQAEMDRLLLWAVPKRESDSNRLTRFKKIKDDFRDLQSLNNKMMATTWGQPTLDYKYISRMTGEIAKKAARLKSNLGLPKSEEQEAAQPSEETSTKEAFKAELLSLDRSVMSFVTNPIFQKTNVMDLRLANQARSDLEAVISMSTRLKKVSAKLGKH